jgi:hypothetical protein
MTFRFSGGLSPREHLPGKPPIAQLTRIDAADRLFSVSLTRITRVPECAVSSVGFLWGSAAVSLTCGVSVGLAEAPDWAGRPGTGTKSRRLPDPNDHFPVTQCHQGDLAGCSNSAPSPNICNMRSPRHGPHLHADGPVLAPPHRSNDASSNRPDHGRSFVFREQNYRALTRHDAARRADLGAYRA